MVGRCIGSGYRQKMAHSPLIVAQISGLFDDPRRDGTPRTLRIIKDTSEGGGTCAFDEIPVDGPGYADAIVTAGSVDRRAWVRQDKEGGVITAAHMSTPYAAPAVQ